MVTPTVAPLPTSAPRDDPGALDDGRSGRSLGADFIIATAPDPMLVSDLEGKILQADDAVSQLLGFRPDELVEQSLWRVISPEEAREFTAALREVVARGSPATPGSTPAAPRARRSRPPSTRRSCATRTAG
jgi:PAS domain-containing protein